MVPKGPPGSSTLIPGSQWNSGSWCREENRVYSPSACHRQHSVLGLWEGCSLLGQTEHCPPPTQPQLLMKTLQCQSGLGVWGGGGEYQMGKSTAC